MENLTSCLQESMIRIFFHEKLLSYKVTTTLTRMDLKYKGWQKKGVCVIPLK